MHALAFQCLVTAKEAQNHRHKKGKACLSKCNTKNPRAPQLEWGEWETGAHRIWWHTQKQVLESTYRGVKTEVQQCVSKLLAEHEWAVAILQGEAVRGMEQRRPTETEHMGALEQDKNWPRKNRETCAWSDSQATRMARGYKTHNLRALAD